MNGLAYMVSILPLIGLACLMAQFCSVWMEQLYHTDPKQLSFPGAIRQRSHFRRALLTLGNLLCLVHAVGMDNLPQVLFYLIASDLLLTISLTDFEQYMIYDRMLLPLAIVGAAAIFYFQLPLGNHLLAAAGGGLLFLLLAILSRGAIGGGDIKLIAVLGLWFGSARLIDIVTLGLIMGGAAALLLLLVKKKNRKSNFAYGPYFALTALILYSLCGL